ncbi:MAG: tetratricopeptide repeat protein [Acidobacteriota bacterium]
MRLILLSLFLALETSQPAPTAGPSSPALVSPRDIFQRAQALYDEGHFREAAAEYESLRGQGIEDGALYYNLGNAYFKSGQLGLAILSYERALRLMPGDEDTQANLDFANELIADVVEGAELPLFLRWAVELYQALRPDFWAGILSFTFVLGGIATSVLLLGRWPPLRTLSVYALVILGFLAIVSAGVLAAKLHSVSDQVEAVVLVPSSDVRSGPGETNPQLVEVHEGFKVAVLGEREDWLQVRLPNGLVGWIRQEDIEVI